MSILGVGLDLASVERIRRLLEGPLGERFMRRCFTERERAYCLKRGPESFAARFAAKEAFVKALGSRRGFGFLDVEVVRERGAPRLELSGGAARALARRSARPHLSLTHDAGAAAAVVVLEGPWDR